MARKLSFRGASLALLGAALIAAIVLAAFARSPWYDELFTLYVTRPDAPFGVLWAEWLHDNHPPLFYAFAWATQGFGAEIGARRMVNLLFLGGAALALLTLARKRAEARPMLFAFAVALAGATPTVERASELRSNFLAFSAGAVALAALAVLAVPGERRLDKRSGAFLCAALALALSVHIAATLIVGSIALCFGLGTIAARDWSATRRLLLVGALAALPFAAAMALQLGTIAGNTRNFWIPAGFAAARWTIEGEVIAALTVNWPLTLAGAAGLLLVLADCRREARLTAPARAVAALGCGMALAVALMLAIHMQRPFVLDRYLVCLHAAICLVLAIGAARLTAGLARRFGAGARLPVDLAMVIAALLAINHHRMAAERRAGWYGTGRAIAAVLDECPEARVHADMAWNRGTMDSPPPENRAVMPFAYARVAKDVGFALEPQTSRRLSPAPCPTLFWTEHAGAVQVNEATLIAHLRAEGYPVERGTLQRIGTGWVFRAWGTAKHER